MFVFNSIFPESGLIFPTDPAVPEQDIICISHIKRTGTQITDRHIGMSGIQNIPTAGDLKRNIRKSQIR